ncbi:MAG: class I SAM-dependent methyltransferase [Oligoflexia bacterium]|nr:class I SAM-dependent methyltransferase [Oligoflexia bacterium]
MQADLQCPMCTSRSIENYFLGKHYYPKKNFNYQYVKCKHCSVAFVSPMPDEEILSEIYQQDHYYDVYRKEEDEKKAHSFQLRKDLEKLTEVFKLFSAEKGFKTFLDFGCGDGKFLAFARGFGLDVMGYEPIPLNAKQTSARIGEKVLSGSLSSLIETQKTFDFILLADVIEHLTNPKQVLEQLKKMLTPQGFFIFIVPLEAQINLGQAMIFLSRKMKRNIIQAPPYHVFLFSDHSLTNVLKIFHFQQIMQLSYSTDWPFIDNRGQSLIKRMIFQMLGRSNVIIGDHFFGRLLNLPNRTIVVAR